MLLVPAEDKLVRVSTKTCVFTQIARFISYGHRKKEPSGMFQTVRGTELLRRQTFYFANSWFGLFPYNLLKHMCDTTQM